MREPVHTEPVRAEEVIQVDGLRNGARISLELEKTEQGTQSFVAHFTDSEYAASFVGTVTVENGKAFAVGLESSPVYAKVPLDDSAKALVGKEVIVNVENAETPGRTGKVMCYSERLSSTP